MYLILEGLRAKLHDRRVTAPSLFQRPTSPPSMMRKNKDATSESTNLTQFFIKVQPYCQRFCESLHSEKAVEKISMIKKNCICSLLLPHDVAVSSHSLSNFIFSCSMRHHQQKVSLRIRLLDFSLKCQTSTKRLMYLRFDKRLVHAREQVGHVCSDHLLQFRHCTGRQTTDGI
jgi:hypothetical protein